MKRVIKYIVLIFFLLTVLDFQGFAQLSPGDLSKAHSHLEGLSNCTKCHELGQKISADKCLECHKELKTRIHQNKGYHISSEVKGKECIKCHSEHNGVNFQILRFEKNEFDHLLTGYFLEGAHKKLECEECHNKQFIKDDNLKSKKNTFLGLNTECLSCHTDYHQQTLSNNCQDCHSNEKFKPAEKFNHQNTNFRLEGKHQEIDCIKCHKIITKNGHKFQEFKGIEAASCTDCHTDVHNNKFGQNCTECHTVESFKNVIGVQNFDHSKTNFNLVAKHLQVECNQCHKGKLTDNLQFALCSDCHHDYHNNQFAKNGESPDCSNCHNVNGFDEFNFTIEQHNNSDFSLEGAHLATPCFECHKKGERWEFNQTGKFCIDCHEDIHKKHIDQKFYSESNCKVCHNIDTWREVQFDHNKTSFALEGKHKNQTCRSCHFKKDMDGFVKQQFAELTNDCIHCHNDVHHKQFETNGSNDCSQCHNTNSFIPASKFDHNSTQFKLDGKHQALTCNKCHVIVTDQGGNYVWYKIEKYKCEDCHR